MFVTQRHGALGYAGHFRARGSIGGAKGEATLCCLCWIGASHFCGRIKVLKVLTRTPNCNVSTVCTIVVAQKVASTRTLTEL